MQMLWKLTPNINLFQLKGQALALSNDMYIFLKSDVNQVNNFDYISCRCDVATHAAL